MTPPGAGGAPVDFFDNCVTRDADNPQPRKRRNSPMIRKTVLAGGALTQPITGPAASTPGSISASVTYALTYL